MKALALLALSVGLAACPKGEKKIEPVAGSNAGSDARLLPNDAAVAVALPPAPPLPEVPFGLPPVPADVIARITPDQVALGQLLFSDPRLSANGKTSCATCHDPQNRFIGVPPTLRKPDDVMPPQLENLAWSPPALDPHFGIVMHQDLAAAAKKIAEVPGYQPYLARSSDVKLALAGFILTRYDGDSKWDHLERMQGSTDTVATAGYKLFIGKGRCATCHPPPLYTDFNEHDVGLATKARTRSLRGCAERKRFFRSGSATSLDQVLDFYTEDHDHSELHKLTLSPEERTALLTFLERLTGNVPPASSPPLP